MEQGADSGGGATAVEKGAYWVYTLDHLVLFNHSVIWVRWDNDIGGWTDGSDLMDRLLGWVRSGMGGGSVWLETSTRPARAIQV